VTGTGGGWGDSKRRPVEQVVDDMRNGYLTLEQAMRDYGVAIDPETGDGRPRAARSA
jgi:N-methylhydantoinase B